MSRLQSKKLCPRASRIAVRVGALMVAATTAGPVGARTVPDLYLAEVPATALSGAPLDEAFDRALAEVLVRVTGRPAIVADADSLGLVGPAAPLVRQYQPVGGGAVRVRFDADALLRRLDAANLPVWADDRPLTLVLMPATAAQPAGSAEAAMSADAPVVTATALARGVPVTIGTAGSDALADPRQVAREAGADLVLVGEPQPSSGNSSYRWTLYQGDEVARWQGDAAAGINGLADRLAARYATVASAGGAFRLRVTGVDSFESYGRLQRYLKSVGIIRTATLAEVSGSTFIFDLMVRGDAEQLRAALSLQRTLVPGGIESAAAAPGDGPELVYQLVGAP